MVTFEKYHLKTWRISNKYAYLIRLTTKLFLFLFVFAFVPYLFFNYDDDETREIITIENGFDEIMTTSTADTIEKTILDTTNDTKNLFVDERKYSISDEERKLIKNLFSTFSNLTLCPEVPSTITVDEFDLENFNLTSDDERFDRKSIKIGGWWQPIGCLARHKTAVIIPYRDRVSHLRTLLRRLHEILQNQLISYRIFVVEQNGTDIFNKGSLLNAAFLYIRHNYPSDVDECLIFHDVDLIPEDGRNMYTCPDPNTSSVRHMSPSVDKMKYVLPYPELVGGVLAVSPELFSRVNGYSNLYRGWGGEDDDMFYRLRAENVRVLRPPMSIGRYKMLPHAGRQQAANRYRLLRTSKFRYKKDGLNGMIEGKTYNIVDIVEKPIYTHITVLLNRSSSSSKLKLSKCSWFIWCFVSLWLIFYSAFH